MLVVVSSVTFLSASGSASGAISSSIRQLFLRTSLYPHIVTGDPLNGTAFCDIVEVSQVWDWLGGPLLSSLFMDDFYSGRPFSTAPAMRAIFNSNLIVSAVTLRQKRALPNSCIIPDAFLSDDRLRGCGRCSSLTDVYPESPLSLCKCVPYSCGSNLDVDGSEDRSDHKARATNLRLAPSFMFEAGVPSFQGTMTSYSEGACVPLRVLLALLLPTSCILSPQIRPCDQQ
jgi:hypothetical protein